jgi:protein SCO1/2
MNTPAEVKPRAARWLITLAAFVAPLLVLLGLLAYPPTASWIRSFDTTRLHGRDVGAQGATARFTLQDANGKTHTASDYRGKVLLVSFGYTRCPDACPTTLARLAKVQELLGSQSSKVSVVFVTIDPERDSPELLNTYVHAFNPHFDGLHGTDQQTDEAASVFHADYRLVRHGNDILVEHTVDTFLVDPDGRIHLVFPYDLSARDVADDTRAVMRDNGLIWPWS